MPLLKVFYGDFRARLRCDKKVCHSGGAGNSDHQVFVPFCEGFRPVVGLRHLTHDLLICSV